MTTKQIGLAGLAVAVVSAAIAYLSWRDGQESGPSTNGDNSPIIQGSSDVTIGD